MINNLIRFEDEKFANEVIKLKKARLNHLNKKHFRFKKLIYILLFIFYSLFLICSTIFILKFNKKESSTINLNKQPVKIKITKSVLNYLYELKLEKEMPNLKELNKKRIFETRLPLNKAINCQPHFRERELISFMSFLTKDNIYFETGSGCSTKIAKYYTKKAYAVEGCKLWYDKGVTNGLEDNLIFKDLKVDDPTWSYPGNKSNLDDWKNYFQAYKKEYNADIVLIDGRFKVATAFDIFNKIRNDTIVLIHEYAPRSIYFIIEEYYKYIYHWDTLFAFVKKNNITEIPLEVQKRYWNESI